jgi:hypothetical protein
MMTNAIKTTGIIFLIGLAACKTAPPKTPAKETAAKSEVEVSPPVVGSFKVYQGPDGIKLAIVRLKDGTYLCRITGTSGELDAKVLPCGLKRPGPNRRYWHARIDGRKVYLLTKSIRTRAGTVRYRLFIPGSGYGRGIKVAYDEASSKEGDADELVAQHRSQVESGVIAEIQRFHEKRKKRDEEARFARRAAPLKRRCDLEFETSIDWSSVEEKTHESMSLLNECGPIFSALNHFCKYDSTKKQIQEHVKEVRCRVGDEPKIELRQGVLVWQVPYELKNRTRVTKRILGETVKWPEGKTLAQYMFGERLAVCTDGNGSYVGLRPTKGPDKWDPGQREIFYGEGKNLFKVDQASYHMEGRFFDPRVKIRHRGDLPWVKVDRKKKSCTVRCGSRTAKLELLSEEKAVSVMSKATIKDPAKTRVPHGLARDRRGVYYYVDRAPGKPARDYRLYRGPLGKLKRLKMTNLVSDTQGDVFATPNGKLRLVLEKEHSYWVRGNKRVRLINVPIRKNLPLIYNDLGIYLGKRLGTPCDIF